MGDYQDQALLGLRDFLAALAIKAESSLNSPKRLQNTESLQLLLRRELEVNEEVKMKGFSIVDELHFTKEH